MQILLVDDNRGAIHLYGSALRALGHSVTCAESLQAGRAALEEAYAARREFDAVILDRNLDRTSRTPLGHGRHRESWDRDFGEWLLPDIQRLHPGAAVAILSGFVDGKVTLQLAEMGLLVVPKELDEEGIADLARLLEQQRLAGDKRIRTILSGYGLRARLIEVFMAAVDRLNEKETAVALGISPDTVQQYWKEIRDALDVRSRMEALALIIRKLAP